MHEWILKLMFKLNTIHLNIFFIRWSTEGVIISKSVKLWSVIILRRILNTLSHCTCELSFWFLKEVICFTSNRGWMHSMFCFIVFLYETYERKKSVCNGVLKWVVLCVSLAIIPERWASSLRGQLGPQEAGSWCMQALPW